MEENKFEEIEENVQEVVKKKKKRKHRLDPKVKDALEWIGCIIFAVVLALLIKYYVGTPTLVKNPSMNPTLMEGHRLILNRWSITTNTELKRGDIVTFEMPSTVKVSGYDKKTEEPIAKYENEPQGFFLRVCILCIRNE